MTVSQIIFQVYIKSDFEQVTKISVKKIKKIARGKENNMM